MIHAKKKDAEEISEVFFLHFFFAFWGDPGWVKFLKSHPLFLSLIYISLPRRKARAKVSKRLPTPPNPGEQNKIIPNSPSSRIFETRAHKYSIIRTITNSTRMTPDCITRSQSSRTVAGGPEGATEGPQATQAPAQGDDRIRVPNNYPWLIQPSHSRARAHGQPRSGYMGYHA